jgi:3-hydroxyisobutyrate dehydrogenase-like beta-hydroxyacid dehydrogenase
MEIGFVGLGTMGGRVALRLVRAGHQVRGYNRTPAKAAWLVDEGLELCDSPRQVAERSQVVFTMVTNTQALEQVVLGPDGVLAGLGPEQVLVDMSTVSPAASRRIAERVRANGAQMLDAPVSGSVSTLEAGQLSVMAAGDRSTFDAVRPVLLDIGPSVDYLGGNGNAVQMKIAINLNLAVQMVAFSEAVLVAEKGGISREDAVAVLLKSVIASPMLRYRGPFVLGLPEEPWFDVDMMQKDMLLALESGRQLDVPMPTTAVANEILTAARGMGLAPEDFAAVFEVLARMSGLGDEGARQAPPSSDAGASSASPLSDVGARRASPSSGGSKL